MKNIAEDSKRSRAGPSTHGVDPAQLIIFAQGASIPVRCKKRTGAYFVVLPASAVKEVDPSYDRYLVGDAGDSSQFQSRYEKGMDVLSAKGLVINYGATSIFRLLDAAKKNAMLAAAFLAAPKATAALDFGKVMTAASAESQAVLARYLIECTDDKYFTGWGKGVAEGDNDRGHIATDNCVSVDLAVTFRKGADGEIRTYEFKDVNVRYGSLETVPGKYVAEIARGPLDGEIWVARKNKLPWVIDANSCAKFEGGVFRNRISYDALIKTHGDASYDDQHGEKPTFLQASVEEIDPACLMWNDPAMSDVAKLDSIWTAHEMAMNHAKDTYLGNLPELEIRDPDEKAGPALS